jgi:glutamate-1-semialdehyde aminotransferase
MSSRYDVIRPDTLEEMRRAGHIAKLEARIKQLEAALREIAAGYETEWSTSTFTNMMDVAKILSERINIARKALEGKDETV